MATEHRALHVSRRRFLLGAGALGLGLLAGCGQPEPPPATPRVVRIGFLGPVPALTRFRAAMAELGYAEGNNLLIEHRVLGSDAADIVALSVDVIVTSNTRATRLAQAATRTIPVVGTGDDFVSTGLVESLAHPGGNVTGVTYPSLASKQLQVLSETVPGSSRVGVLYDPDVQSEQLSNLERPARQLGLRLYPLTVRTTSDVANALQSASYEQVDLLYVMTNLGTQGAQSELAALAIAHGLPSMYENTSFVPAGGLMYYGANQTEAFRRIAYFVVRIINGASPADLPVEQPMTFTFVINLKTAQALGLTIPEHVLLQATEVIE
jgi:putative ABC transport system substrate-binding protein